MHLSPPANSSLKKKKQNRKKAPRPCFNFVKTYLCELAGLNMPRLHSTSIFATSQSSSHRRLFFALHRVAVMTSRKGNNFQHAN